MGTAITIISAIAPLIALGYGVWRKYLSPEAELAKLKAEYVAKEAAAKVEIERLGATFRRIDKEKPDASTIADRLNRPIK